MDDEDYQKHLKVVRNGFREQYQSGDKLAVLDCVRWCHSYHVPLTNPVFDCLLTLTFPSPNPGQMENRSLHRPSLLSMNEQCSR